MNNSPNNNFIKEVLTDLIKRGIFDLDSEDFNLWCIRNDFITANIKQEIYDFKKTEEGQRFIIHLQGAREKENVANKMADWIVNCDLDVCQICANYKLCEGENSPEDYPDDIEPCPFLREQGKTACQEGIIKHFQSEAK